MPSLATVRVTQPSAIRPELRVEAITDFAGFLSLEPVWNRLVEEAGLDHPFLEYVWARTWWECFGEGSSLHILVVTAGKEAIAIAPLILTETRLLGIPVRRLGFLYNSHVPRADFLIGSRSEEVYVAIWRHLSSNRRWDLLQLCQLPAGSDTLKSIPRLAAADGYRSGVWQSGESPFIPLHAPWPAYQAGLTAKHRSNLRNRFKRLALIGDVEMETIASGWSLAVEEGLAIEAAAWKKDAGTAIACDPNITRFYSILAQRAAEQGWLRLHFLTSGTTRVAFDYSLQYRNRMFLLKVGYEPAFAPYSPSNLLLARVLENAFEQGLDRYDFLGENADWKQCWANQSTPNYWLFVFAGTAKGRCLHFLKFRLTPLLKRKSLRHVRNFAMRVAGLHSSGTS